MERREEDRVALSTHRSSEGGQPASILRSTAVSIPNSHSTAVPIPDSHSTTVSIPPVSASLASLSHPFHFTMPTNPVAAPFHSFPDRNLVPIPWFCPYSTLMQGCPQPSITAPTGYGIISYMHAYLVHYLHMWIDR